MKIESHLHCLSNAIKRLSPEVLAEIKIYRTEAILKVQVTTNAYEDHAFENEGDE